MLRVYCVVEIGRFAAPAVRAVDVRLQAHLLGLTLARLRLIVLVVLFEELICGQVAAGASAVATAAVLLGKHIAEIALLHLRALIGGLLRLCSLAQVLLLAGKQSIRDLLHSSRQRLLLRQRALALVARPILA